ncbi:hypothetical protein RFM68_21040 [Mesorhizobium sp. MSK_1335]|uniref:Uncharacterized protein n=1 Tax=Mesorhizobium montanum TaxID=3072323 RepID=A0ABU4ZSP5_9HYPH|nr:hypothetical protein [Mesorhizobium sp. MSK_1335]MDX8526991.1 hypothetical protein [Mesorhizobium sp. MSK_1335]
MKKPALESDALKPPDHSLEGCFGRSWQLTFEIRPYIRALERDLATEIARNAAPISDRAEIKARYERAICDLEERDERIAELQARMDEIVRVAVRLEPGEEIMITKEIRRPLGNDAVRTKAEPDNDVNAVVGPSDRQ